MSKPFEELKKAREQKQLSLKEAAEKTRIDENYLAALENAEFSGLPDPLYVRGFIRRYSKLLEIDAKPMLDAYKKWEQEEHPEESRPATTLPSRSSRTQESSRQKKKWLAKWPGVLWVSSIAVLLIAAGVVTWLVLDQDSSDAETVQLEEPQAETADAKPEPKERPQVELIQPAEKGEQGDVYGVSKAEKVTVKVVADKSTEIQVRSGGPTGEVIASKALSPNQTEEFSDPEWISLRVDHPHYVKLYVNGVYIDTSLQQQVSLYQFKKKESTDDE
ncbi:helix-turn-helix transcriptional regulator [Thermoactinomyces sp. CICC 23799]|uniref:helix-turn-helix domain-containing protein n=1 Tax=Thermoactinomyces sp. CICC 23799 TaxID=2767429 RepID=UPI0018DB9426|nr:helix-turn-helix domain-containing protein [Thermoactinomyces sp. CICC 23799]MBH8602224.1 helix-turn-helix domain-containing protein [Thermoactinomyces sp. CICC 23799]